MKAANKNYSEVATENKQFQSYKEYFRQNVIFKNQVVKQKMIELASCNDWLLKASREADINNYLPL